MTTLTISKLDDGSVRYEIDGYEVIEVDSDVEGFPLMEKIDGAMRRIAELVPLSIEEFDSNDNYHFDEEYDDDDINDLTL